MDSVTVSGATGRGTTRVRCVVADWSGHLPRIFSLSRQPT
jgi:hypothetical protein